VVASKRARSAEFRWGSGREAPLHSHGHSEDPISLNRSNSKVRRGSILPVARHRGECPFSARLARCRVSRRRSLNRTDSGRSVGAAGTGPNAPFRPFVAITPNGSGGWRADLRRSQGEWGSCADSSHSLDEQNRRGRLYSGHSPAPQRSSRLTTCGGPCRSGYDPPVRPVPTRSANERDARQHVH
jgi:hypothetical protein